MITTKFPSIYFYEYYELKEHLDLCGECDVDKDTEMAPFYLKVWLCEAGKDIISKYDTIWVLAGREKKDHLWVWYRPDESGPNAWVYAYRNAGKEFYLISNIISKGELVIKALNDDREIYVIDPSKMRNA